MMRAAAIQPDLQTKLLKGLVLAGGLYAGYRVGKKFIAELKERNTAGLADQSPEVRQAMGLRSALNPSGISWLMWSDGTNEDAIAQLSTQISNLEAVSAAYRNLYGDELMSDLQGELSSNHFNTFLQTVSNNRINRQNGSGGGGTYTQPQRLLVAKKDVFVRTSPDASYHGAWYEIGENKNIFKTATAGEFIGYATGKQHYDAKNDVKFIEVAYRVAATNLPSEYMSQAGQTKLLWISASTSFTEQFSSAATMEARYPSTKGVTRYLLPVAGLGWLSSPGSRIITQTPCLVMDQEFNPICQVDGNVLLGYPVMNLDGSNVHYTLFRTLDGQDRWVASESIIRH